MDCWVENMKLKYDPKTHTTTDSDGVETRLRSLVPRVQKIKIRNSTLNRLPIVQFVKKIVYLGAHYSERQGLMG